MGNGQYRESKDDNDLITRPRYNKLSAAPNAMDELNRHLQENVYGHVLISAESHRLDDIA